MARAQLIRELARRAAPRVLAPLFHSGNQEIPNGLPRFRARLNQAVFERGLTPPWVLSRERCEQFWETRTSSDPDNSPETYARKSPAIVDFLHGFWIPEVGRGDSILELGCNAGANLARLHELGHSRLAGVEINRAAIQELRRSFPGLAQIADIRIGRIDDVLAKLPPSSFDVVFTMAVLIHIHPASHNVFTQMVRVARRQICVIEAEWATTSYIFARNYRRVFHRLGCPQIRSVSITRDAFPGVSPDYWGYTARLFAVDGTAGRDCAFP